MVLNDEQVNRFFDTMDSLLYFVNERFRVVKDFSLEATGMVDDVKASMVAHALWDNVEIIDEFVRENPYRLPKSCLDVAAGWRYALPGFYTLVRYQSGRALLMNDVGVFSVCGVTYELEGEIGPAPAGVEIVLLPFDDVIVYDGFLQAYDVDQAGFGRELRRIQDEFEERCSQGIVSSASEFLERAKGHLAEVRERELDNLLADVSREGGADADETLPAGFHRGALAGLSGIERDEARDLHMRGGKLRSLVSAEVYDRHRVRKREPVESLSGCLSLLTKEQLATIAVPFELEGFAKLRKAQMVEVLSEVLPKAKDVLHHLLVEYSGSAYDTMRLVHEKGTVEFALAERNEHLGVYPMEPFTFMFRGSKGYTVLIPEELRPLFDTVDYAEIERERRRWRQALSCANACAVIHGVATVDDVYAQYRSLCADALDPVEFRRMLIEESSFGGEGVFAPWSYLGVDYIVYYTLGADYVAQRFAHNQVDVFGQVLADMQTGEFVRSPIDVVAEKVRGDLVVEMGRLEQFKRDMVGMRTELAMKPLTRSVLEQDILDELFGDPNVLALRAFLDEHVPDGEDDYQFADKLTEELVMSAIETGSLEELFAYLVDEGLGKCSKDEMRLPQLVTNMFNAMPSWENNGWSPHELYEQMTGRKLFYNPDGSVMRIGPDDNCPCGSGKKYRDCCGN